MTESYDGALREGRNLTEESAGFAPAKFRDELAATVIELLARRRSVLLVGPSGVGKTSLLHEVVARMRRSGRAGVVAFAVSQLLTGTRYLGDWETKVNQIIAAVMDADSALYFTDIWNLPSAAKASDREGTAWDLMRPYLEQGRLRLIGEVSPEQLLKLSQAPGFARLFEAVTVPPLTTEQIVEIVAAAAGELQLAATPATVSRCVELCRQFLPAAEGPGPALELLSRIRDYQAQKREVNEPEDLSAQFVEKVFSIYSGLPPIVVSPSVTQPVAEIVAWFQEQIVGQRDAIHAVVDAIALYKAGLHDPARPIGSFLFVGPTGVGKTELARALAKFLFGSEDRLLRFDLSEFKDYHAFQTLIGDPANPGQPARLVDPVRARPFQVILLDEIEKAHPNVWDLLLQLLDEGRLTPGVGRTVSFRNTIVIATSNVGAKEQAKASPGFVSGGDPAGAERVRQALEAAFRPELLNRFQHVCVFHALRREDVRQIAQLELRRVLERQGIAGRDIAIDVTPGVLDLVVEHGYDARYGARALRRMVQRFVAVPIATLLLERPIDDGSILRLVAAGGAVTVEIVATERSRAQRAEAAPIKTRLGQVSSKGDIVALLDRIAADRSRLAQDFNDSARARTADDALDGLEAWRNVEALARVARQREIVRACERRLERLHQDESDIRGWLERAASRAEREKLIGALLRLEDELQTARRELVLMPEAAAADALIELRPLGSTNEKAIELFRIYGAWARRRGYTIDMVCEPLSHREPIVAALSGHYSYGYLRLESGHHRFRDAGRSSVVRVRVMPWTDVSGEPAFTSQRALKQTGLLGGRVRSRLDVAGAELVIQNERTLVANHSFAGLVVPAYLAADSASSGVETEVRRYDAEPFLIKDFLTGASGRADTLAPDPFHALLARRVEAASRAAN